MQYTIIHEIPGRVRLRLAIPRRPAIDGTEIEKGVQEVEGVELVSYSSNAQSLLIHYRGDSLVRSSILHGVGAIPSTLPPRSSRKPDELARKRGAVLGSGAVFLLGPLFLPPAVRALATVTGALPIVMKGVQALARRTVTVDVLDASAISAAVGMGDFRTAGMISLLLKIGAYLEEWTRERSRRMLSSLFHTGDEFAWLVAGEVERRVSLAEVRAGDLVVVRTGGRIPVDGVVTEGEALVNQASMTGEPLPVLKREGLMVYAGTAVEEGRLTIRVVSAGDDTRVARIVKAIEDSELLKAEAQSRAEELAERIVPYSFLLSGLTWLLTGSPVRAASVLLVDYSCAIKLSTPLTIMAAMTHAARKGILIKGGRFIQKMAEADVFVLDKTGTLTQATPRVVEVVPFNGFSREFILRNAACVEEHFPHSIASAVVNRAAQEGLAHEERHAEPEYILAHGIATRLRGKRVCIGSRHFIQDDEGIDTSFADQVIRDYTDQGYSILYMAIERELAGIVVIEDPVREESRRFLALLRASGVERVIMLTGDNEATARQVAQQLAIREYVAEVFPERKTELVNRLKGEGRVVTMVGDGINDSPALSSADVGISLKDGAEIAREACDVLLLSGDLTDIIHARNISRQAMALIQQNFRYIVGINSTLIGLGLLGGITPALSALMHNSATVLVTLNSLRPLREEHRFPRYQ
ncbi:MAG: heavy metal translocating P-type ATPase [Geobacteraceae bacterium]|nr:heavy metal translocating P-type ATPase [Geobacteraceae bacterium]